MKYLFPAKGDFPNFLWKVYINTAAESISYL